jgi:phosphoribosyl 1,2-cyclic phosphodiesterase
MKFASLGSGSKGNGTLVATELSCVLIDCGFSVAETVRRMARLGLEPSDLDAILVTHEHGDHVSGVLRLAKRFAIPVYASHGTIVSAELSAVSPHIVDVHQCFSIGDINVTPVAVPHDAREPCQYVFRSQAGTLGVLTDLGSISAHVVEQYQDCDALMLEFNHDEEMLRDGPYHYALKQRVAGDWGHLSNRQAAQLLAQLPHQRLQHLVVSHVSDTNNTQTLARQAVSDVMQRDEVLLIAEQEHGFSWMSIN